MFTVEQSEGLAFLEQSYLIGHKRTNSNEKLKSKRLRGLSSQMKCV